MKVNSREFLETWVLPRFYIEGFLKHDISWGQEKKVDEQMDAVEVEFNYGDYSYILNYSDDPSLPSSDSDLSSENRL